MAYPLYIPCKTKEDLTPSKKGPVVLDFSLACFCFSRRTVSGDHLGWGKDFCILLCESEMFTDEAASVFSEPVTSVKACCKSAEADEISLVSIPL